MLSTAYYFLQVILCSAIMMGYYWIALRNKKFHQYNRFYLLAVALFSWLVPLIKIQWTTTYASEQQVVRLLSVVADNNSEIEAVVGSKGFHWTMEGVLSILYMLVSVILLIFLCRALYRIYELLKTHSCKKVGDIFLIITQVKGTPFSFFRYIFWNEEIDIRSASGKQILQHELTHVQQQHTVDKLLIQVMLIPGWFNPFFWLLKKEMDMIHEFIADKKAVRDGDTAALAQMLLTAVYPKQRFDLVHPFFFSPIKRRLQMLTNHKNPRFSYVRRLVILPLLAVVIVLFAFRNKEYRAKHPISVKNVLESVINDVKASKQIGITVIDVDLETLAPMKLSKTYRVVINPGHGGEDIGAKGIGGITESALTLQLAKMLKEKNINPQLEIILTRTTDVFHTVVEVVEKANVLSPDLFISLHMNSGPPIRKKGKFIGYNQEQGAAIYLADKTKTFNYDKSYQLANWIGNSISQSGTTFQGIKSRGKGIYVLQAVASPTVLIEAGYVTHKEEVELLKSATYQEKMAKTILQGIEQYLAAAEKNGITATGFDLNEISENRNLATNTIGSNGNTAVNSNVSGNNNLVQLIESSPGTGTLAMANENKEQNAPASTKQFAVAELTGLEPVNTKQVMHFKAKETNPENQQSAITAEHSNLVLFEANSIELNKQSSHIQVDPSFPGGEPAWRKYLERNLKAVILIDNGAAPGKYEVKTSFMVDKTGKLSDIKILHDPGYGTAPEVIRVLSKSPNWNPAQVNGKAVICRFEKTVTFMISEEVDEPDVKIVLKDVLLEDPLYLTTDEPPYFPGGLAAWAKYLERNLDKDLVKRKGGPKGKYTVALSFQVDEHGNISNIKSNDPGFGTKEEAVRIIKKGPNWKPAINKGKPVRAEHKVTITFMHS